MTADPEDIVVETVAIVEDEDTYHDSKAISNIATIANVMAWVILALTVIGIIVLGIVIYDARASVGGTANGVYSVVSAVVPFFPGFFFFVALKAIAEGLYVLIDIEANTRR